MIQKITGGFRVIAPFKCMCKGMYVYAGVCAGDLQWFIMGLGLDDIKSDIKCEDVHLF